MRERCGTRRASAAPGRGAGSGGARPPGGLLERAYATLPVAQGLPRLREALAGGNALLTAPPGSGKTTLAPLDLLAARRDDARIVVVTPRQVAARAAARRMSQLLGTPLGGTVGYHVRWNRRAGRDTRVTVMTEGMLLRQMEADPELPGIGLVILDEFHERSLDADLLLALLREVQDSLRPDLKLLVMSATLEVAPLARLLIDAPVLRAEGRQFPVTVAHGSTLPSPTGDLAAFAEGVARAVRQALEARSGDALVFLPGMREQRAVAERLQGLPAAVHLLHGSLDARAQDAALAPAAGRKVILSTPIAQTSLTVEGVDIVVDSGWERIAAFDAAAGADRLLTRRISRASAEQRAGRAGRLREGFCLRLWSQDQHGALSAHDSPEILRADLATLLLRSAHWGHEDPATLGLPTPPPEAGVQRARALLQDLGALDSRGRITPFGRDMLQLPLPPRLAAMLLHARSSGTAGAAVWLAVALEDDSVSGLDIEERLRALAARRRRGEGQPLQRLLDDLGRSIGQAPPEEPPTDEALLGRLLCHAFPDRIARRRVEGARGRFLCADGGEAQLPEHAALAAAEWLVVAHWQPGAVRRARLVARLDDNDIRSGACAPLVEQECLEWDARQEAVVAERRRSLGAITVERRPWPEADAAAVSALLCDAVMERGLDGLPWSREARDLQARIGSLRAWRGEPWPDLSDAALQSRGRSWLLPWLAGMTRQSHLRSLDMLAVLRAELSHAQLQELDRLAPARITVPSGQAVRLDYSGDSAPPVLAVKLQALFGLRENPRVNGGEVPVQIHLLSPASRPLQVTQDLASFWRSGYPEVARELRGRYPKHPWPEDPLTAKASMRTRRRA